MVPLSIRHQTAIKSPIAIPDVVGPVLEVPGASTAIDKEQCVRRPGMFEMPAHHSDLVVYVLRGLDPGGDGDRQRVEGTVIRDTDQIIHAVQTQNASQTT